MNAIWTVLERTGRTGSAFATAAIALGCSAPAQPDVSSAQDDLRTRSCRPADAAIAPGGLRPARFVAIPNIAPGGKFSYDIGVVDAKRHRYLLADRSNGSLDIVDTRTLALTQVAGFAGVRATNDVSGPNGVVVTGDGRVFVGDSTRSGSWIRESRRSWPRSRRRRRGFAPTKAATTRTTRS
ncbi:MAG: hypothetical protein JOZ69_20475, partial [Myxococcales bacterium]|nr:hypothetical protein [Myxococcales bacterium]